MLFSNNSIGLSQDSSTYTLPRWHVKILPLAFINPVNPTIEIALAARVNEFSLVQGSFGYIDHFYNENHFNKGFRTALEVQRLINLDEDGIGFFLGIQSMFRELRTDDYEVIVTRFNGSYQQLLPYQKKQHSWYLHATFGGYSFINKHLYFNWKIALGGRTYREYGIVDIPNDAVFSETERRFGILDQPGEDWKQLPSFRLAFNIGFGWW